MNQTVLYVIIVTYYAHKWVDKFMGSINQSTIKPKVIIVDNGSGDDTVEIINNNYPEVCLIENNTNLGFGAANNIALQKALNNNADYVFLLNQDAWIESDTFENLINISQKYPEYGIISPMQINPYDNKLDNCFSLFITRDGDQRTILSDLFYNKPNDIYSLQFIQAAGWLITKKCLKEVGLFDPLFFHYGEDSDYCKRVIKHHLKIGFTPKIKMFHAAEHFKPSKNNRKHKLSTDFYKSYSYYLNIIKNYEGCFIIGLLSTFVDIDCDIIKDLIHRNFHGIIFRIRLKFQLLVKFFKIVKARKNTR